MRVLKYLAIALCVYVGIVVAFESLIGFFQPANESTLVLTTTDGEGNASDRVLARLESDGRLYVAANHWPRRWYKNALANPEVEVSLEGGKQPYRAAAATDAEADRLHEEHGAPLAFRILTGFPPREFVRLDPR